MKPFLPAILLAFLTLASTDEVSETHITYYLDEICRSSETMITVPKDGFNSSVILKSSKEESGFRGQCSVVLLVQSPSYFGDGFLVTKELYKNDNDENCENYIDFHSGSKKITRWCNESNVQEFGSPKNSLTMDLNTEGKGTLQFEIVFTVYSRSVVTCYPYFGCSHEGYNYCIAKELHCDGVRHCIEGEDQKGCSTFPTVIPTTPSASTAHSTLIPISTTRHTTVTTSSPTTKATASVTTSIPTTTAASTTTDITTMTSSTTSKTTPSYTTTTPTSSPTSSEATTTHTSSKTSTEATTHISSKTSTEATTHTSSKTSTEATTHTSSKTSTAATTADTASTTNSSETTPASTTTPISTTAPSNVTVTTVSGSTTSGTEVPSTAAPPVAGAGNKTLGIVLGTTFAVAILIVIAWFAYRYYKRRQGSYDPL